MNREQREFLRDIAVLFVMALLLVFVFRCAV